MVTDEHRAAMYFNARCLFCLKELSSFLFDRIIMAFSRNTMLNTEACSVNLVRELLSSLNDTLLSLKTLPSMTLLESLFVFQLQEKADAATVEAFDMGKETRALLVRAEESLEIVREFNRQVPLTWIIRCATKVMSYAPKEISGGEDWFKIYKDFWRRRIEKAFSGFIKDRRQSELFDTFKFFLKGSSFKMMENAQSDENPGGTPLKESLALSFLLTFYSVVFMPDINRFLRPILIDGEFLDRENRAEFAESYNNLIKLEDDIKKLDWDISSSGNCGKRYAQARSEMSPLPIKRRKLQLVLEDASKTAQDILDRTVASTKRMVNIIYGILGRDLTGRYQALANLSKVAGKDSQFIAGLEGLIEQLGTFQKILDDIESLDYIR
jgi:hypothetical protein